MTSQSSVGFEEEDSAMVKVDAGVLHEKDELSPWMSQLFEKLDLEVDEDICSTEKMAEKDAHPFQKDANPLEKWCPDTFDKETSECTHPAIRAALSDLCKYWSRHTRDNTEDCLVGVAADLQNSTCPWPSWAPQSPSIKGVRYRVPEEVYALMEEEGKENSKRRNIFSYKKTLANGMKWMSEECLIAFRNYVGNINSEDTEHKFGELRNQCFSFEAYDKIFHHFNFTIETKLRNSDIWTSELYFAEVKLSFAEVKQLSSVKYYFCSPLEASDNGHCYGCKNQRIGDLIHPSRGGYEEGDADICYLEDPADFYDNDDSDMDDFY